MKKILFMFLLVCSYVLCSCQKSSDGSSNNVIDYIENLESYTYNSKVTITKNNREMNIDLDVVYKKPYYNICFSSKKLDNQFIVKNSEGVFVLTPKADKQFEFESDWPLNSSHAYILEAVINDIKNDSTSTYTEENGIVTIKASASSKTNPSVKTLEFVYDFNNKIPLNTYFYDSNNNKIMKVTFENYKENPSISNDKFNVNLIMEENQNESTGSEELSLSISCGYIIDGVSLTSQEINDNYQILCYSGDASYTIVARNSINNSNPVAYIFSDYDEFSDSLILYDESRAYMLYENMEVSVYSSSLSKYELYQIISEIELV